MFSSVKNFLSRHKRKFIVTGVVVGGTVLAVQYAQRKLREFQEAQAREFIERTRRTQHFESTERTCNQAIMGVAPTACDQILQHLDTGTILEELRKNPDNKHELWHELKILSFTRLATLVYACSMLVVSLRVQINILGGYLYKDTVSGEAKVTTAVQENYLSLSQHFLQKGIVEMAKLIESKVRTILSEYDLKQQLTLADTEQIFYSIQMAINSDASDPSGTMGKYIYPTELENNSDSVLLAKLFAETLDMLESEESASLNTYNVSRGFTIVMDSIADFYYDPVNCNGTKINNNNNNIDNNTKINDLIGTMNGGSAGGSGTKADLNVASTVVPTNINNIKLPLAKLIPIINGLAGKPFSCTVKPPSLSTSLVTLYLVSDKVKMFGANTYEVFCQ